MELFTIFGNKKQINTQAHADLYIGNKAMQERSDITNKKSFLSHWMLKMCYNDL